jgi:hypothetical protein
MILWHASFRTDVVADTLHAFEQDADAVKSAMAARGTPRR